MASKLGQLKIITQTNKTNTGTVLFLHGSGDTGPGVYDWVEFLIGKLNFPHIKFLFPTAPLRSYTPLGGELSTVWFDRQKICPDVPEHNETIESTAAAISNLIEEEVKNGIPLNKIIIGGFSMGGALALQMAYRFQPGLAGVFALSSFLNDNSQVYEKLQQLPTQTPLLMCHGERDTLVLYEWGHTTFNRLAKLGVKGEFTPLRNTFHELNKKELKSVVEWILKIMPNNS